MKATDKGFLTIKYPDGLSIATDLQWDGQYLCYVSGISNGNRLHQLKITGHSAKVVNTADLLDADYSNNDIWLYKGSLFGLYKNVQRRKTRAVAVWTYPNGGEPIADFYGLKDRGYDIASQLTVSVAPSH